MTHPKTLRNLEQLSPERRARLEALLASSEQEIEPLRPQPIVPADSAALEQRIETGVILSTLGELLEQARLERGVGVRELARRLDLNHARIKQLEGAGRLTPDNLEVQTLARQAKALSYRLRIVLEPEEGGKALEARLG